MWRPKASLDLVAMDNGFFLVKFSSVDDCEFVKCGGPWLIFDHYLTVCPWRPNFDTEQDELKSLLVWVRILCLPIEDYDHAFLMKVGEKIGKPVRIDDATSLVSMVHSALLCFEVDLQKPLVSKFELHRKVRRLEYEGIHLICFNCGRFNHQSVVYVRATTM